MKKKLYTYVPLGILVFLVITNPSIQDFRTYLRIAPTDYRYGPGREKNFFIFSIYSYDRKYIGAAGNFFGLDTAEKKKVVAVVQPEQTNTEIDDVPYKERVYFALKKDVPGFNKPEDDFYREIKNKDYALKVYLALKANVDGFSKSQEAFFKAVNE